MSTAPEMRQPLDGLPRRILDIEVNGICEIADMGRDDPEVIKLWIGEGDLPTASFVTEAAIAALREGHTRYSYALGLPRLRRALADYHKRHWGVDIPHDRFSVTVGGMNAIMQAMQAVLEPGDEVLHPSPAWPNLAEVVRINNGAPVPVPFDRDGGGRPHLDLDTLFAAVTPRTRVIAINSPSNPTGWIMPKADMARLVAFARERGLWILSDEVYNHFTYGNAIAPSFLELTTPDDRLIVTNTFSKNWAMTGWRAGWLVYPRGMDAVFDNLSNTTRPRSRPSSSTRPWRRSMKATASSGRWSAAARKAAGSSWTGCRRCRACASACRTGHSTCCSRSTPNPMRAPPRCGC